VLDISKMHVAVHGKDPVVMSDFNQNWNESRKCSKYRNC